MQKPTNLNGNPANIYTSDLVKILGQSPFMAKAMADCPDSEWQKVEDSFNQLMWEMVETAVNAAHEAAQRRKLRAIQVGDRVFEPDSSPEIEPGTQPRIFKENGVFKATVETPNGEVTVSFKEKKS